MSKIDTAARRENARRRVREAVVVALKVEAARLNAEGHGDVAAKIYRDAEWMAYGILRTLGPHYRISERVRR